MPKKLLVLPVLALLCLAAPAQALSLPDLRTAPLNFLVEEEEDEVEAEVSEDAEVEIEECLGDEEEECVEEEDGTEVPPECVLTSAEPLVLAASNRDRVRLQIRYTTTSPTQVSLAYGLHGGKGSLYLGDEKKRFGKRGVLRLKEDLTEAQMEKVMAAKSFTVRLRVLDAPGYCQPFFDRQLDLRRTTPSGLSWEASE